MAALALLANWVRVYTVIEAGYLTDMHHYLVSVSHYWFGWGVFALALFAFFWLTTWLPVAQRPEGLGNEPASVAAGATSQVPGVVAAALLLAVLPGFSSALRRIQPRPAVDVATLILPQPPWSFALGDFESSWMPVFAGADQSMHTVLESRAGEEVEVFAVGFAEQRQGAELVGSSSTLFGAHLKPGAEREVETKSGAFMEIQAHDPAGMRSVIWSRYEIDGHRFLTGLPSQLWYGFRALTGRPRADLVAARVECGQDCRAARAALSALADSGSLR